MKLKVGDKVKFLNERGGGVVSKILSSSMVNVALAPFGEYGVGTGWFALCASFPDLRHDFIPSWVKLVRGWDQ